MNLKRWKLKKLKPSYEDLNKFYFVTSLAVFLSFTEFQPLLKLAIGVLSSVTLAGCDSILVKLRARDREAWQQYGYLIEEIRKRE